MALAGCENGENKRLKSELAELKKGIADQKTIVEGSVNEYGRAIDLPSVRILLARPELKRIFVPDEGVSQEDTAQFLATLSNTAGALAGIPSVGADKHLFLTLIKFVDHAKHDLNTGEDARAYSDRYYSKDYSYVVISLATALLKEKLIISEAADVSTGCIIKAQSPKPGSTGHEFFSFPKEYIFLIQPSEHGIHVFGASTIKHKFYSFDKPEQTLNKILDKVG